MRTLLNYIRLHPSMIVWMVVAWIVFAFITTILSTYPILSDYALRAPQVFLGLETWESFLSYTYNLLPGGIVNIINTLLFGFWVLCFVVYRRTYIEQGLSISRTFKHQKTGTVGSIAAILGGGCIGCGFTFLTNIFGAALGSVIIALPLKGAEIGLLGTVIITASIARTLKQLNQFTPENTALPQQNNIITMPATALPMDTPQV